MTPSPSQQVWKKSYFGVCKKIYVHVLIMIRRMMEGGGGIVDTKVLGSMQVNIYR